MQYILVISKTKIKMHHEDVMGHVYSIDEADRKLQKAFSRGNPFHLIL